MSSNLVLMFILLPTAVAGAEVKPADQRERSAAESVRGIPVPTNGYAGGLLERSFLLDDPGGFRSELASRGIRLEGALITDYSSVFEGGADEGASAFRHLFEAGLSIETEPLVGLKGGEFFVSFVTQNGEDGSEEVGDFQAFSNIDEADFTAIYELYYEQQS